MKIFESPRRRRRLIKIAVVLALVPLAYLGVHFSHGAPPDKANGPVVPNYAQPKHFRFTKSEQAAVHPVLARFIKYAVAREDPAKAWDVAGPDLRSGLTHKKWDTGAIPVVNYPASHKGLGSWSYVKYTYGRTVGLEVFVFPKPGSGYSAMTADAEVRKDSAGRWQVNYWMPERFHGPASVSAKQEKAAKKAARAYAKSSKPTSTHKVAAPAPAATGQPTQVRGIWLLLPVGILSLIILAPLTLLFVGMYRNRRAERESLGT